MKESLTAWRTTLLSLRYSGNLMINTVCPRYGGEFDVRTGKAVQLPAMVDVPAYPVKVADGMIQVGLLRE